MANIRNLPKHQAREYFPNNIDWQNPSEIRGYFQKILDLPVEVDAEAKEWLSTWRELDSLVEEEYAFRYVEMTCDTESKEKAERFQFFSQSIFPIMMEMNQKIIEKSLDHDLLKRRLEAEAPLFYQGIETDRKIYRSENIPLFVETQNLGQEYKKISGAQTVEWEGKTVTLVALRKEWENNSPEIREKAFRLEMQRRLQDKQSLDTIFSKLLSLRQKIAKNAGFSNYRDYAFLQKHRFDYTPADCTKYHQAIKDFIVPILQKLHKERKKQLGLTKLRPWDLSADILKEDRTTPFQNGKELEEKTAEVFMKLDTQLSTFFADMQNNFLFDLDNRKGKAPGGYQIYFPESKKPFIFMNAVGAYRDILTLLHEGGHSFHSLLSLEQDHFQKSPPMEFAEVASMSMELISLNYLAGVFGEKVSRQLVRQLAEDIPNTLIKVAMVDLLQHWIYTSDVDSISPDLIHQKWLSLHKEYLPEVDISGIEDIFKSEWHRILHIFELPFYYIEYGIAQIGALQFRKHYLENAKGTLSDYKNALQAGGSLGLKDLFSRARLKWSLQDGVIQSIANDFSKILSVDAGASHG